MASTGSNSSAAIPDGPMERSTLIVGVISYRDGETIGSVAAALRDGLATHFADVSSRLVLADTGSMDTAAPAYDALGGSAELLELPVSRSTGDLLELPYHGIPGKARALRAILAAARDLDVHACVVFDAGVSSVAPEWIDRLVRPVLEGALDFVAPYYTRPPFEGALTKGIVYPLVRALYAVPVRQPAPAEFACSRSFVDHLLAEDLWERDGAQVGIDLWLATAAASGEFRQGEVALGVRAHRHRDADALDLATTITQVVGSLFADLERRAARWQRTRSSSALPRARPLTATAATEASHAEAERLIESYCLGYRELRDVWTWVLPPRTIVDLGRLVAVPASQFRLDDELWARIVYDFALGYRLRVLPRDHLLRSLVPLYSGWLASFILQVRDNDIVAAEQRVEELCHAFELQKAYLISRWRWPERLRTG